jgi:serine/threonine protein kinase
VCLQDVFVTPRHLAIVMEYCNGGDLASLISKRLRHGVSDWPVCTAIKL